MSLEIEWVDELDSQLSYDGWMEVYLRMPLYPLEVGVYRSEARPAMH
jgi:hypothetical protein